MTIELFKALKTMNTQNENGNSETAEVEEVTTLAAEATDEEKSAHIEKIENQKQQLYARLKKAEGFVKDASGKWVKPTKTETTVQNTATTESKENLSQRDVITLVKADIPEEDIPDVTEYAAFKKISIADALKSPVLKSLLADKAESRKIADATNVGTQRRGNSRVSDESLIENASKGKLPESDDELERLVQARISAKTKKNKRA